MTDLRIWKFGDDGRTPSPYPPKGEVWSYAIISKFPNLQIFKLLFFSFLSFHAHAQSDTLSSPFSTLRSPFAMVWMPEGVPDGHKLVEVRTSFERGRWMAAQDAGQARALRLAAEGKSDLGNLSVWGRFGYGRTMEDSTRLRHQTRNNPDAPFYFGSMRNNYYERDTYKIDAIAQYRFRDGKIPVTLGLDYRVGNHFSNNDPRARVADHQLDMSLAVGRNFASWAVHLRGLYGYGRERVGVGYKDGKRMGNTSDSTYMNWQMNGFGYVREWLSLMQYNDDFGRHGASLHLARDFGDRDRAYLNAGFTDERQLFKRYDNSPLTYAPLNEYDRRSYRVDLLWTRSGGGRTTAYRLEASITDGRGFNHAITRKNYVHRRESAVAEAVSQRGNVRLEGRLAYSAATSEDGAAGIRMEYARLEPMLTASREFPAGKGRHLAPTLSLGYSAALGHSLVLPGANVAAFAQELIGHDYLYRSTSAWRIGAGLDCRVRRGLTLGFRADYSRRAGFGEDVSPAGSLGKGRVGAEVLFAYEL